MAAMQRDLNLTADEVLVRLAKEDAAARVERKVRVDLGASFGGAWLTAHDQQLVVAITDAGAADRVRALGARPRVVARSARQLGTAKARLDLSKAPAGVAGWYVDVTTNTVVVLAAASAMADAAGFVAGSGADPAAVRIQASAEQPRLLYDLRGGDAYYPGNTRCSIGFSVTGGFVTAGHCGGVGTPTVGVNGVAQGTVAGSSFPGVDYGWVAVNANWTPTPQVNASGGTPVEGSQEAVVGASVCRSGSTTGTRCGVIQAKNATVNYVQGTVRGLTRTTACAEGGDSGGSWLSGLQAQGVTSGGSGNCTNGGITYFQPLLPILAAYGLTLTVANAPPYTVIRSATSHGQGSTREAAISNGIAANKVALRTAGINCNPYSSSTSTHVWTAPDGSWHVYNVTTRGYCTN